MKFAHVYPGESLQAELAVVRGDQAALVSMLPLEHPPASLQELLTGGPEALSSLKSAVEALTRSDVWMPLAHCSFASAVLYPPAVLAVGLNYDEHASELDLASDSGPVLFALFPNSLQGHLQPVQLPTRVTQEVDYEGELGVIIGTAAKNVSEADALNYVFGYTVVNDITARDLQFREPQWSRCKSFDTFTPNGPVVVTADEITDPQNLHITTDVDGLRVQDSSTAYMIRSVARIIAAVSQSLTLLPGTLISTGSPGGAGRSRKPPLYLVPGTEVTVTIDGIGALTSHCVEA